MRSALRVVAVTVTLAGTVVALPSSPVQAAMTGFRAVQSANGWVDFDGDGRADTCQIVGGTMLSCVRSTGTGFTGAVTMVVDPGYGAGRAWADFNGDARADYCRVVGSGYKNLRCTVSMGTRYGGDFTSGAVDPGYDAGRAWADFNGDGRSDFCRIVGGWDKRAQCTLSTGTGYGSTITSAALDPGWDAGRSWVDVNGDNRADYCRVVGSTSLQCTLSNGNSFGQTFTSAALDAGYDDSRRWADVNGDSRADYCRIVGSAVYASTTVRCTLSAGTAFGASFTSPTMDAGYPETQGWGDVNGDGRDDYCRVIGGTFAQCTLSNGTSFGSTFATAATSAGFHGWVDADGDGRADHCRREAYSAECDLSTGASFGSKIASSW
ncbi:hypothetical protein [Micromonospora globbae]|uniref:hypothetical protein n=1 Tax=Micromonospora globbae TaxID=1894969 RepID=UPI0011C3CF9E|nr:hypothetical protein [Micromonospora globbae]